MPTSKIEGTLYRQISARVADLDQETRTLQLSFSSEAPVTRSSFFDDAWTEVLGHNDGEPDLSRLSDSAPLLWNHKRDQRPIGVVERAWLEDGQGRAEVRFSKRADVDDVVLDVQDGILRNVSVGYQINERTLTAEHDDQPNEYRVTRWTPMEISIVDIPADQSIGIGRAFPPTDSGNYRVIDLPEHRGLTMDNDETRQDETQPEPATVEAPAVEQRAAEHVTEQPTISVADEQARVAELHTIFRAFPAHRDLYDTCRNDLSCAPAVAREMLLEAMGRDIRPVTGNGRIETVADARDNYLRGAELGLMGRGAMVERDAANEFQSFTVFDHARYCLERHGIATGRMSRMELLARAITHTSGDFTALLANVANKAMINGFNAAETTYQRWCRIGSTSDFRAFDRVSLTGIGNLPEVKEGAEYTYGTFADSKETAVMAKHGQIFSVSREAMLNDDLNELIRTPQRLGDAARRTVDRLPYTVLNTNGNMRDGSALFVAGHSNLAASGAAPDATTVDAGRTAMATQTNGPATAVLNIMPAYALVPYALFGTMSTVIESETKVLASQNNSRVANPVRNAVRDIIPSAWLDQSSATAWYLAADPNNQDTVEVTFLDGNQTPTMEQQGGWEVDGTEFKVRIDAVATALDWRGLYKNAGS